jgi:calcineurin-like phosphoesterase
MGRVFLQTLDCPFRTADTIVEQLKLKTAVIIVDLHAEATSEKSALGWFLDGRVSAVIGTHTHVQTADERILPLGTGFISDVGMVGARDSVIGVGKEAILERFIYQLPKRFEPEIKDPIIFNAVILDIDEISGKTLTIKRVFEL